MKNFGAKKLLEIFAVAITKILGIKIPYMEIKLIAFFWQNAFF